MQSDPGNTSGEDVAVRARAIYGKHALLLCSAPLVAVNSCWLPMFTADIKMCLGDFPTAAVGFSLMPRDTGHLGQRKSLSPHVEQ